MKMNSRASGILEMNPVLLTSKIRFRKFRIIESCLCSKEEYHGISVLFIVIHFKNIMVCCLLRPVSVAALFFEVGSGVNRMSQHDQSACAKFPKCENSVNVEFCCT